MGYPSPCMQRHKKNVKQRAIQILCNKGYLYLKKICEFSVQPFYPSHFLYPQNVKTNLVVKGYLVGQLFTGQIQLSFSEIFDKLSTWVFLLSFYKLISELF